MTDDELFNRIQDDNPNLTDEAIHNIMGILKQVKKTENKNSYILDFGEYDSEGAPLMSKSLYLTPTIAQKLAEAVSALVEYITVKGYYATQEASDKWKAVCEKADEARESYQESQ